MDANGGYAYVREPSDRKPLHALDATPYFSDLHPADEALSKLLKLSAKASSLHAARKSTGSAAGAGAGRVPRERAPRIFDVLKQNDLKTVTALEAHANAEAAAGRTALAELCTKHGAKLQGFVDAALSVADAPRRLRDATMSRLDKLRRTAAEGACDCDGVWQTGALRILELNEIDVKQFCGAVCRALSLGARRGVNVGCFGVAGCGKSTLLEPFEFIFETLGKPQKGSSFPFAKLPNSEIMLWQDFEHDEDTVAFTDLLSIFVGESVELRAPCSMNRKHRNTSPLFYAPPAFEKLQVPSAKDSATMILSEIVGAAQSSRHVVGDTVPCRLGGVCSGRTLLECSRRSPESRAELNRMMGERFVAFEFATPLPKTERRADWVHCGRCCAAF